ncbi:MAG TPA: hypothetical protein VGX25_14810 [Actinophytocola sp.]|uniref:hypothetical protein n=1 Tax=Actinophytocola sp. TaxID=1872138 RepID=UPI002DDD2B42|nr:hypothetical protein [Actinophytocola sp.]HEV2780657.1 hypothetical protein [Actinophytocola sp.]
MRRRLGWVALPLVGALVGLPAGATAQPESKTVGRAIGDAGTGLAIVRVTPQEKQSAVELGLGLASAEVNSEAARGFERAVAQAAPGGVSGPEGVPETPGTLSQTAPPDNKDAKTGGLRLPSSPLDALVKGGALNGSAHARWSDTLGPCVGTISDASTELASLSVLNAIPSLPNVTDLSGRLDAPNADAQGDQAIVDGIRKLAGPLSTLGGVLAGAGGGQATGSVLSLPNTMSVRSTVGLVDIPGSKNKAVQSTSTMRVAAIKLLAGTPFEISINVVSQPTLQVTSTGEAKTSTVRYTAPVLEVVQGGRGLGRLDAANPKLDIPIGIPLAGAPGTGNLPIIGDLLASGQPVADAVSQGLQKLDLGVIRLSIAQLSEKSQEMTQPFKGFQLAASARMLDLQVLPTAALGLPNLPSALAQVSLGEQIARAFAPMGGVVCGAPAQPAAPPAPMPQGKAPTKLAHTSAQYQSVEMFWTGTGMLLLGVVLVAAFPVRREPVPQPVRKPTPYPRQAETEPKPSQDETDG